MDKSITKRKNYNADILNVLREKFGYSVDYIRKALRGDRVGEMPDTLKQEYRILEKEAIELEKEKKTILKEKANNLK